MSKRRPVPVREIIHQCEFLEYEGLYLELFYPDEKKYQRWALRHQHGTGIDKDKDVVSMSMICFCPGCGIDLRRDLLWRVAGRPAMNEMLDRITKEAAQ